MSTIDYMDCFRTGPDTIAGKYMRKFWHPVFRAEDLKPGWTKPIRIMGEDFTLYRGESGRPPYKAKDGYVVISASGTMRRSLRRSRRCRVLPSTTVSPMVATNPPSTEGSTVRRTSTAWPAT